MKMYQEVDGKREYFRKINRGDSNSFWIETTSANRSPQIEKGSEEHTLLKATGFKEEHYLHMYLKPFKLSIEEEDKEKLYLTKLVWEDLGDAVSIREIGVRAESDLDQYKHMMKTAVREDDFNLKQALYKYGFTGELV